MSRSFKRYPFCKDNEKCKKGKRHCNKVVRRTKDIPNGRAYKKLAESWDFIYDYSCSETWEEYKKRVERPRFWREVQEANYYDWYKYYKQK
jgi:hypothetical protein